MRKKYRSLTIDFVIIAVSIYVAITLAQTGALSTLTFYFPHPLMGSLIAGMFFTSVFTTAPSVALLLLLVQITPLPLLAIVGGAGAVIGDLIIFYFIRDRFGKDLMELIREKQYGKRWKCLLRLRLVRNITFLIGGLIIASPLPDELGISLLGFSKMRILPFVFVSFVSNATGIFVIGLLAQAL
ncbi:MAG: hypothetical protein NUV54_01245 [Candidatus Taylorbacteria bacterium]|nr:hypothetical protein [Candidatus Taylorbacteria bacterium]